MRKLTVIMLALLMVLSSATMAMAAPFDLIKADGSETHSFIDFIDSPSIFDEVANNMTEYLIEDSNGQLFRVSEVQDSLDAGAETLADAVVDLTPVEINEELTVESVSAIDANTISVTFEGIEEAVEIELEEALVHGQTEVSFVYNEVEYTAELTEAYVDPAVVALEAAKTDAKAELAEYVNEEDYTENADELTAALAAGEEAIDAATTEEEVAIALADAKAAIDEIKTDAELVEEA